ncbi:MAG: hypothetical protein VR65_11415 [Desulfobulbaceae bacterium BRH_c16a]|nr:MAG: hypothetical protein VR65_11415 [Desulfobulbaceae bacterium BRH_c16a]
MAFDMPASLSLYRLDTSYDVLLKNISLGGCFFPVEEKLPIGEKCQIVLKAGEGLETREVTLTGIIVRSDAAGVGIRFIDISPSHDQLAAILSRAS